MRMLELGFELWVDLGCILTLRSAGFVTLGKLSPYLVSSLVKWGSEHPSPRVV